MNKIWISLAITPFLLNFIVSCGQGDNQEEKINDLKSFQTKDPKTGNYVYIFSHLDYKDEKNGNLSEDLVELRETLDSAATSISTDLSVPVTSATTKASSPDTNHSMIEKRTEVFFSQVSSLYDSLSEQTIKTRKAFDKDFAEKQVYENIGFHEGETFEKLSRVERIAIGMCYYKVATKQPLQINSKNKLIRVLKQSKPLGINPRFVSLDKVEKKIKKNKKLTKLYKKETPLLERAIGAGVTAFFADALLDAVTHEGNGVALKILEEYIENTKAKLAAEHKVQGKGTLAEFKKSLDYKTAIGHEEMVYASGKAEYALETVLRNRIFSRGGYLNPLNHLDKTDLPAKIARLTKQLCRAKQKAYAPVCMIVYSSFLPTTTLLAGGFGAWLIGKRSKDPEAEKQRFEDILYVKDSVRMLTPLSPVQFVALESVVTQESSFLNSNKACPTATEVAAQYQEVL